MTPEQLNEIEARTKAATPESWDAIELPPNEFHKRPAYWVEAEYHKPSGTHTKTVADVMWSMADAEFIAHARQDVPALLAVVQRIHEWANGDVVTAKSSFGDGYREAMRDIRDLIAGGGAS